MKKVILFLSCVLVLSLGFNIYLINFIVGEKENFNRHNLLVFNNANSRDTYFSIHNIRQAQEISTGKGIKIGILDHYFGYSQHPDLYAGGEDFYSSKDMEINEHGYWMATVLKEIAPDVEVYALNTMANDEKDRVKAMVDAIHWAVEQDLDVLTYSATRFTEENKKRLNEAVDYAIQNNIVISFIHYDHSDNILSDGLFSYKGENDYNRREPDLNILHYDYNTLFLLPYWDSLEQMEDEQRSYIPYLSISSTSLVTAGFVALLRELNDQLTPAECKQILMETSRKMVYQGEEPPRVPDIYVAVQRVLSR